MTNTRHKLRRSWLNHDEIRDERHVVVKRYAFAATVIDARFWARIARAMQDSDRLPWSHHEGPFNNRADRSCRRTTASFPPVEPIFDWSAT